MKKLVSISALFIVVMFCFVTNANAQTRALDLTLSADVASINLGVMRVGETVTKTINLFIPQLSVADVDVQPQMKDPSYVLVSSHATIPLPTGNGLYLGLETDIVATEEGRINTDLEIKADVSVLGINLATLLLDIPVTGTVVAAN